MSSKPAFFSYQVGKIDSLIRYSVSVGMDIEYHMPLLKIVNIRFFGTQFDSIS